MVQPLERRSVLVRYHEVGLKGANRNVFITQLRDNLRAATEGLEVFSVRKGMGLVKLDLTPKARWPEVREAIARVFGVTNFMLTYQMPVDLDVVEQRLAELLPDHPFASFKIAAERRDKSFPQTSFDVNCRLGEFVERVTGARVDVHRPECVIRVEVLPGSVFLGFDKIPGPGGLPVGVGGRLMTLISGGIDSPVAALRMMRRGARTSFVHFHGYPFLDDRSTAKARQLVQHLTVYQFASRLIAVPFGEIQRQIVIGAPEPFRVVLYRRLMIRIAEALALRDGASALVTGESLGQVASQTLENLRVIDAAAILPVLRPLIGMDKQEIINQAEAAGTYEISIQPDQDCCTLFMPRHPATKTRLYEIEEAESRLPIADFVAQAVAEADAETFAYRGAAQAVALGTAG